MVRNTTDQELTLPQSVVIGKIMFFDISDTILSANDLLQEVQPQSIRLHGRRAVRPERDAEPPHEPFGIQSSRVICAKAYLMRNTRLSFEIVLPGARVTRLLSRTTSGVIRKATMCEMLPVMLM